MLSNSIAELDRRHLVHPLASWRAHEQAGARFLASAKGATVIDAEGHSLLDGFAGLWCVNAGYGQDHLIEAATRQLRELPYATGYFGLGSESAARLAGRLADHAPGDLNHVYFGLGGSDAVDSTIRFVRHYWQSRGAPERDQFISVEQGYHGSSAVGSGLTALPVFHTNFGVPLDWQHKVPSHYPYRNPVGEDAQAIIAASVADLRGKIAEIGAERVAAFYLEPIQGSGGVLVPPPGWVAAMHAVCKEMMTTAKGLTSGYVPMSAAFLSDHVYETIADGAGLAMVGHGQTYSAHPVSAAVALAALDLYEGGLLENGAAMGARLMAGLQGLADHPLVGEVRGRGMLAAVELVTDKAKKTPLPAAAAPGTRIFDRAWQNGLIIRAFTQGVLGYAPPLCCTTDEIDRIVDLTRLTLDQTLADPDVRAAMA